MVHIIYDINAGGLNKAFPSQYGNGAGDQQGYGPYFQGVRYQRGYGLGYPRQRGHGLGSLLKTVWQFVSPLAKTLGKSLTQEGLSSGARILENIAQGAEVKDAVVTEGKQALRSLAKKASNEIQRRQQSGSGGIGKKRKKKRAHSVKPSRIVGRSVPLSAFKKRRRIDSLGVY